MDPTQNPVPGSQEQSNQNKLDSFRAPPSTTNQPAQSTPSVTIQPDPEMVVQAAQQSPGVIAPTIAPSTVTQLVSSQVPPIQEPQPDPVTIQQSSIVEQTANSPAAPLIPTVQPTQINPTQATGVPVQQVNVVPQSVETKTPLVTLAAQLTFRGDENQKPRTVADKIIGIVSIIIVVLGSAACIYAAQHVQTARKEIRDISNPIAAKREEDAKKAIKESGPDTQKSNNGELDVSKLFDQQLAQRSQDIKAEYGEQVNMANGVSFVIIGEERGWTISEPYATKASSGKEFLKIAVNVGFRGKEGSFYLSTGDFKLQNSKGGLQDAKYISDKYLPGDEISKGGSMNPGDKRKGWLVYEVDKGEQNLTLIYQKKGFDTASKEFFMKGSVGIK